MESNADPYKQTFIVPKNQDKGQKLYNQALDGKVEAVAKGISNNNNHKLVSGNSVYQGNQTGASIAKILESEDCGVKTVTHNIKIAIQKARQSKGWNQKQFADELSVKQDIIKDYENGKAQPDNALIAKMEKVTGCKLPRMAKGKKNNTQNDF